MKPLLKWAGGKRAQAELIDRRFGPCDGVYAEPFVGSAAVFLYRASLGHVQAAHLSDSNPRLVNFHRQVRDAPEELIVALEQMPGNEAGSYAFVRNRFNASPAQGVANAADMLWLNKTCFNGLYRENRSGDFNVPWGKGDVRAPLPPPVHIRAVSQLLQRAKIEVADFRFCDGFLLPNVKQVYCDPPYIPLTPTASFTSYTPGGFTEADHRRLAELAVIAVQRGATVILSNHDVPLAHDLYGRYWWETETVGARRSINSKGNKRQPVQELLAVARPRATFTVTDLLIDDRELGKLNAMRARRRG